MSAPPIALSPPVAAVVRRLRLREVPRGDPWQWTVGLLQAAMALCRFARAAVQTAEGEAERTTELHFAVPGADFAAIDLGELLLAALEDAPVALGEPTASEGARRFRIAVAVAVNAGLAQGPTAIEVITPGQHAIFSRSDAEKPGRDPYRQSRGDERRPAHTFVVRVREPRPSFGRRLATFLALRGDAVDGIARVWERALLPWQPAAELRRGVDLHRQLPGERVRLGDHALWARLPEETGVWLVRESIKVFDLGKALAAAGVDVAAVRGWIECPRLRLTADGAQVAQDGAFELLVAWLLDARAHTFLVGTETRVVWPSALDHVPTASGRPVPLAMIEHAVREGRDFPYEWPHRREQVPSAMQARTYVLWPSELAVLGQRVPGLQAVPARSLGEIARVARADLSILAGTSLAPIGLGRPDAATLALPDGRALRVSITAYVHRSPSADEGAILLLAYGRRLAQSRDDQKALPGVTLVCELAGEADAQVAVDELRGDREALAAALARVQEVAAGEREALLAHAFTHEAPWELPLVRAAAAQATPPAIGLAYAVQDGRLRLTWSASPLHGLEIGATRGGQRLTLEDALRRLRDRGGLVVDDPARRWLALEPGDADAVLVRLTPHGRALCLRVLGPRALWEMPTAPELHLQVEAAAAQRHLLLAPVALEEHRRKLGRADRSRDALVAHLLVASALGEPTGGLEAVPLFTRYDPRALTPSRRVSLTQVLDEAPRPRLWPAGAVGRELADVVIEASPGEALLLHEVIGLGAAARGDEPRSHGGAAALRRRGGERAPLVTLPVADAIATGVLRIDNPDDDDEDDDNKDGGGRRPPAISLWASGLHIDDLRLPEPLGCVGGRLWLSDQGIKVGSDRLADHLRGLARDLVRRALADRRLHPPESAEARALAALIERLRQAPAGDAAWVADLLPRDEDGPRRGEALARSLQRQTLRRLIGGGPERLTQILRQSLGGVQVTLDTAILSWKVARILEAPRERGGGRWHLELGRRSAWVQRGLGAEPGSPGGFDAAALILAVIFHEGRAQRLWGCEPRQEAIAVYRLLALAYAHG